MGDSPSLLTRSYHTEHAMEPPRFTRKACMMAVSHLFNTALSTAGFPQGEALCAVSLKTNQNNKKATQPNMPHPKCHCYSETSHFFSFLCKDVQYIWL